MQKNARDVLKEVKDHRVTVSEALIRLRALESSLRRQYEESQAALQTALEIKSKLFSNK